MNAHRVCKGVELYTPRCRVSGEEVVSERTPVSSLLFIYLCSNQVEGCRARGEGAVSERGLGSSLMSKCP